MSVNDLDKRWIVEKLIQLMIMSDEKGLLYQDLVDHNLKNLLEMFIDLKPYFGSCLPYHKISGDAYPAYHHDGSEMIVPSQLRSL
jgi:hypothetical protein